MIVTALTMCLATSPAAAADPAPELPAPTGRHPVGATSMYLNDTSRQDPWVPSETRQLMVTVFYPAASGDGPAARYMTPAESAAFITKNEVPDLPPDILSRTRTNSVADARPAGRPHSLPLVVLSPGYTKPRATLTALAQDLASHGYLVVVIGHTYEDSGTSFPDGRLAGCASCEVLHDEAFWQKLTLGRAADVSFVLDELTGRHPKWRGANLIDRSRIAMGGHSAGGGASPTAMLGDDRIRAGFDIDGGVHVPIPEPGLSRPFMFLGKQRPEVPEPCADGNWQDTFAQLTGWKRWLSVTGAQHASFTDVGLFADQFGLDLGATVSADRVQAITRAYLGAFLDRHLLGIPQPLLAAPSPRYPEVVFCG